MFRSETVLLHRNGYPCDVIDAGDICAIQTEPDECLRSLDGLKCGIQSVFAALGFAVCSNPAWSPCVNACVRDQHRAIRPGRTVQRFLPAGAGAVAGSVSVRLTPGAGKLAARPAEIVHAGRNKPCRCSSASLDSAILAMAGLQYPCLVRFGTSNLPTLDLSIAARRSLLKNPLGTSAAPGYMATLD
jgi:hypothetical protein